MSLRPGESISGASAMQLQPMIPPDIPPGNYELCAVVDPTNAVRESNEGNNRVCHKIRIRSKVKRLVEGRLKK